MSLAYSTVWLATFAQLLPVIPVVPLWQHVPIVRRWVAFACVLYFLADVSQYVAMKAHGNNLWIFLYTNPFEDAAVLWALSYWQVKPVAKLAFRVAIPLFVITYAALTIAVGETKDFQTIGGTFRAVVLMAAVLFTFLTNLSNDTEGAFQHDWAWTSLGFAMYFGVMVSTNPIAGLVGSSNMDVLKAIFTVKNCLDVIAFLIIMQGMRCPLPNSYSGSTSR